MPGIGPVTGFGATSWRSPRHTRSEQDDRGAVRALALARLGRRREQSGPGAPPPPRAGQDGPGVPGGPTPHQPATRRGVLLQARDAGCDGVRARRPRAWKAPGCGAGGSGVSGTSPVPPVTSPSTRPTASRPAGSPSWGTTQRRAQMWKSRVEQSTGRIRYWRSRSRVWLMTNGNRSWIALTIGRRSPPRSRGTWTKSIPAHRKPAGVCRPVGQVPPKAAPVGGSRWSTRRAERPGPAYRRCYPRRRTWAQPFVAFDLGSSAGQDARRASDVDVV
jgi:hypothetical protein